MSATHQIGPVRTVETIRPQIDPERLALISRRLNAGFQRKRIGCAGSCPITLFNDPSRRMWEMKQLDDQLAALEAMLADSDEAHGTDHVTESMMIALSSGGWESCLDERLITSHLLAFSFTLDQIDARMGEILDARVCPAPFVEAAE
jgi:hypothetical protein